MPPQQSQTLGHTLYKSDQSLNPGNFLAGVWYIWMVLVFYFMPEMAWFALYVLYSLLFLLLTAFDLFYGTTLLVFPRSLSIQLLYTVLINILMGFLGGTGQARDKPACLCAGSVYT